MAEGPNNWVEGEKILRESQTGFRKGRGTRDHIFVLNTLINKQLKTKEGGIICSVCGYEGSF